MFEYTFGTYVSVQHLAGKIVDKLNKKFADVIFKIAHELKILPGLTWITMKEAYM